MVLHLDNGKRWNIHHSTVYTCMIQCINQYNTVYTRISMLSALC
jgi:hypothetical protein